MCALRTYVPYPTFPTQSFFTEKKTDMEERDAVVGRRWVV